VQWLLYGFLPVVFWPAWAMNYLGIDLGPRATQFLVDHPSLYLTAIRLTRPGRTCCSVWSSRWWLRRATTVFFRIQTDVAGFDWSLRD
jgi:hypothetical protein